MKQPRHFCTLFDSNYLLKGIVMLQTLARHCPEASVQVLCMNDLAYGILGRLSLPRVHLLRLDEVESDDLRRVKPGRSAAEYCWTMTASLCWHVLQSQPEVELLTYLDADLMFFSDVEVLFDEIGDSSIAIVEHRFMPRLSHLEVYGRFNVEWVSFRRDRDGLRCLKTWRDQCIEWCFAQVADGKLGDQKYLDDWPAAYPDSLCILQHKGAGVAPWNFSNYRYSGPAEGIRVDEQPLVFYHFHQFQVLTGGRFDYMSSTYQGDSPVPELIYGRYVDEIHAALKQIRSVEPGFSGGIRPAGAVRARRVVQRFVPLGLKNLMRRIGIQTW